MPHYSIDNKSMEPNQSNLPDQSIPDAAQLTAAGGAAAVDETLSLAEVNSILGKNYKDKATALAAVKETYNFVGKKIEAANPAPAEVPADLVAKVSSLEEQVFYSQHPEYKGYEAVIKAMGSNPAEVVGSDAFKTIFEKAKVADAVQQTKSVVASNSRLGAPKQLQDEFVNVANAAGSSTSDVAAVAAKAVAEALGGN
jgi:hypothetical protein